MAATRPRRTPPLPPRPEQQHPSRRRNPVRSGATVDRPQYDAFRGPPDEQALVGRHHDHDSLQARDDAMLWAILLNEAMREVAVWRDQTCRRLTAFLNNPYDAATGQYLGNVNRLAKYPFLELKITKATQFSIEATHREYPNEKDRAYARYALSDREGIVATYYGFDHFDQLPYWLRSPVGEAPKRFRDHLKVVVTLLDQLLPKIPQPAGRRVAVP